MARTAPKFTATRSTHGKATRITIRDTGGNVIDTTESKTMRYVEVRIAKDGGILARSQSPGGTADAGKRHPGSIALVVQDEPAPATLTAEREAAAKAEAAAPAFTPADVLPQGATTKAPPSGAYLTVLVGGKSVGYVSTRRGGALLVEVLTSRLGDAPAALLNGTKARQNQTALLVNDHATRAQARALFAVAAATLAA